LIKSKDETLIAISDASRLVVGFLSVLGNPEEKPNTNSFAGWE
jgi:hypothetical protein